MNDGGGGRDGRDGAVLIEFILMDLFDFSRIFLVSISFQYVTQERLIVENQPGHRVDGQTN